MRKLLAGLSELFTGLLVVGALVACVQMPLVHEDIAHNLDASVRVESKRGQGSGTWISPTEVLTARHVAVLAQDQSAPLQVLDSAGVYHKIVAIKLSPQSEDLAIIVVDTPWKGAIANATCTKPEVGDRLYNIGNPNGYFSWFYSELVVGGFDSNYKQQGTAPVSFNGMVIFQGLSLGGQSGGGMFTGTGELVGVLSVGWDSVVDPYTGDHAPTGIGGFAATFFNCDWLKTVLAGEEVDTIKVVEPEGRPTA